MFTQRRSLAGLYRAAFSSQGAGRMFCSSRPNILFVGFLWPEHGSSAAGVRTMSLVKAAQSWGWNVSFLACATPNSFTRQLQGGGVSTYHCLANRSDDFDAALESSEPNVVVFDRFMTEEAFSFQVRRSRPSALRVLDMQDFHALRRARQAVVSRGGGVAEALAAFPDATDDYLARELGSIHRSDLTLVCSCIEKTLLSDTYGVLESKLQLAPFFCGPQEKTEAKPSFQERRNFMTIGTFHHAPNVDSVRWLSQEIWPLIRRRLPTATMSVYGSYAERSNIQQYHSPKDGFLVKGRAGTVASAMAPARVCLGPLRFGAGIKGKIVDAWTEGLPVVTTPIGAEGMVPGLCQVWKAAPTPATTRSIDTASWGGFWQSCLPEDIANDAVWLHENECAWEHARIQGRSIVDEIFSKERNLAALRATLEGGIRSADESRRSDFVGRMLWFHTSKATEYFSRWIELKEIGYVPPPPKPASGTRITHQADRPVSSDKR